MNREFNTELYTGEKTGRLYEIKQTYDHSAVISDDTEESRFTDFSVIAKPSFFDNKIDWRVKYDGLKFQDASKLAKEINFMYESIENKRTIKATAEDIDKNIIASSKEVFHYDLQEAYDKTAELHSEFDISLAAALTIHYYDYDGRISSQNKQWAENFLKANNVNAEEYSRFSGCNTHLAIFDGFTNTIRKNTANRSISQLIGEEQGQDEDEVLTQQHGRK